MAEESLVAMWASMASWFTPTSLFLFLNLMIGTIALSAKFTSQKNQPQQPRNNNNNNNNNPTQQNLFRPTSMLERVKSINFSLYRSGSSDSATILQQYSEVVEQTQYSNPEVAEQTQYSNSEVVEQTQYSNSEVVEQTQYSSSNSDQAPTQQLARVPSLIDRVKSFKFSFIGYHQSDEVNETQYQNMNLGSDSDSYTDNPSVRAELASYREEAKMEKSVREKPAPKPKPSSSGQAPMKMEKSVSEKVETKSKSVQAPVKMMMRSVSEKLRFWRAEEDENVERRRPATVRGGFETVSSGDGDEQECVNEKADDFINRFRNQLKLQRLDSMIRYKDMITRGSSR